MLGTLLLLFMTTCLDPCFLILHVRVQLHILREHIKCVNKVYFVIKWSNGKQSDQ